MIPSIEPPCRACEDVRHASGGNLTLCKRHRRAPVQTHLHYAYPPPFGLGWTFNMGRPAGLAVTVVLLLAVAASVVVIILVAHGR